MKKAFSVLLLGVTMNIFGQTDYPKDAFRSPLDIPLVLAGTFGELRSNHFHSGIDIKTQQREGLPVFGIADGSVTRIKVSHWGYGKVLYVAHPNGYTSVTDTFKNSHLKSRPISKRYSTKKNPTR